MAKIILLCLVFSWPLYSSVSDVKLKILKKRLTSQGKKITSIVEEINLIEENLSKNNNKVIDILNRRKNIEDKVYKLKKRNESLKHKFSKMNMSIEKALKVMALKKINDSSKAEDRIITAILEKSLNQTLVKMNSVQTEIKKSQKDLKVLEKTVIEYIQAEKSISEMINKLEKDKKTLAANYIESKKKKSDIKNRLFNLKKKFIYKTIIKKLARYRSPIKFPKSLEYKNKGVTYNIASDQDVYAVADGTVIHTGTVGSYGNVVMVEHKDSIQSVTLGDMRVNVKKGQKVKTGQLIGRTIYYSGKIGKVYIDLREKKKVLDTYSLIDKSTYKVESSKNI